MDPHNPAFDGAPHEAASLQSALYDRVIENSPDLISIVDRDYVYRKVNSAYRERYKKTEDEPVGKHVFQILGSAVFEDAVCPNLVRCFAGETIRRQDWFEYPDLGKRYMEVSYYPLSDGDTTVEYVAIVARDITEHKNAEDASLESESRYRLLAENIKDVIWTLDPYSMQFTYISPSVISLRGYTAEEAMALSMEQTLTPPAYEKASSILARELSPENIERGGFQERYTLELEEVCKDGSTVHTEETATVLLDNDGKPREILGVTRNITDRKCAEQSLRDSEERYHRTLDASHDMIVVVNAHAKILFANKAWVEHTGYSIEETNALRDFVNIHAADRQRLREAFQTALEGTPLRRFEYRHIHKDGSVRWVEGNGDTIDWPGAEKAIIGVLRDVTEGKQAEQALRESEEKYRVALESAYDPIFILNRHGEFLSVNHEAAKAMNSSPEKMVGKNLHHIFPDAFADKQMQIIGSIFRGERTIQQFEELVATAQGEKWYNTKLTPIRDGEGETTAVMGIARDITEHKRMDEKLRLTMERYHRILDSSHDMILVLDSGANILFANRAWRENASYTFEEINEMNIFNTIHPDDRDRVKDYFEKAIIGQSARNIEYRSLTKENQVRWFETNADPIDWPDARRATVIMAREVTQRKQAEKALERSLSLVGATLDATADGIVAIDMNGEMTSFNEKFLKIFRLPESVLAAGKSQMATRHILDQIHHPEKFFEKVRKSYEQPDSEVFDILEFKDGRIVERYIKPQKVNDEIVGGVLSFRDITSRRQIEEALRKSEEKYRSIFWEAPDIFYTLDLESYMITDANKYALDALEYDSEILGTIHVSDIIHPDDFDRTARRLRDMVVRKDRTPNFPVRLLTRTGRTLHTEQNGVIIWGENGKANTFLGLAHDVTYRTQQEEMIRKRNERIAVLYEVAKAASETLDLNRLIELMLKVVPQVTNSKTMAIYSLNSETRLFEYLAHYGIPQDAVEATNRLQPEEGIHGYIVKHQKPLLIENLIDHPLLTRQTYVSRMDIESALVAPLIFGNEVIGFLWVGRAAGNSYDEDDLELISAMANHIAIAIANARLYTQVREREARLQSILETSRDGIALISSDRHATYRNRTIAAMFGYDESDAIFDMNTECFFHPESRHVLEDIRERLARGEEIRETFRFKGMRKDGSTFDAEARLGNFFEEGKRYGVAVVRDVTEQNRLRSQLEQSGKLAAIGELAAGVAHEINNPIATLDVQTGLMRDILGDEEEYLRQRFFDQVDEYLDIVENQVQRCQSVTKDLLSFGRRPKGRAEMCEINTLLEKTIRLISSLTEKKHEIQLKLDERLPLFFGDPSRLEQVFVNLLNNALNAIQSGGSVTVTTRTSPKNDICVEFKDTGAGMDPEIVARIFDPFFTTKSTGGGTGLGLSISYYIVKDMNGTIDVESYLGKGATFTVTLPNRNADERSIRNE